MKYLIFTFFILNTSLTVGQTIEKESISNKYQAQGIIMLDTLKADIIFTKAKEWIILNYKSAKDVIQLEDEENLKIIVKGNFKTTLFMKDGWISHSLILDFKDGKMRYTYTDFNYFSSGSGNLEFESKSLGFKKSLIKNTEKDIKSSIDKLKKYISENSNINDDW